MPKAYSYIRFSSAIQQKGDSLKRQTTLREEYLAQHPELDLDTTLNLTDLGVSAYDKSNITKGALGHFLTAVKEGKIEQGSYLLVESLDRLSRAQVMDALEVFLSILNAGITIVSLTDGMVYSRQDVNDNFTNLIMSIVIMSRATEESATKSKRIRRNWDVKRENIDKKRLTARCPYWMKPTSDATGFELIPERVEVVKRIFGMAKDGIGNSTITKRLNEEGIAPFSSKTDGWNISYIQKIFSSKAVYGEFQMHLQRNGEITSAYEPIANYYPAIMGKEEWLLVNSIRVGRRTRGGVSKGKNLSNLFSGLLRCGYCAGSMVMGGYVNKKPDGTRREAKYVACSHARRGMGCRFIQWDYAELELQIIKFCRSVDFAAAMNKNSTGSAEIENAQKKAISIEVEIAVQESKLNNLLIAIEDNKDATPKTIMRRISEIEAELASLKNEKELAEFNAARLASNAATHSLQQDAIAELTKQLKKLDGTELHDLRIRLSERLKRAILQIYLYPIGSWLSDEKRKLQEIEFPKLGYSKRQIKKYHDSLDAASIKANRFMFIFFENGENLRVSENNVLHNFNLLSIDEYLKQ